MPSLTALQFLKKAFSILGRDTEQVVSDHDFVEQQLGIAIHYCPEQHHLELEGGVGDCNLAEFFLYGSLTPQWKILLSEQSATGGLRTAMGFVSDAGALVVILTDDEDLEFQRVSLELFPGSEGNAEQWLEREKRRLVSSEVERAVGHLDQLASVAGRAEVEKMLRESLAKSA